MAEETPRFSRAGSVTRKSTAVTAEQVGVHVSAEAKEALNYAKKTQDGLPEDLLALSARLEEVQKRKDLIFTKTTCHDEKREIFFKTVCGGQCSELRLMSFDLSESAPFTNFMLGLIVMNSLTMIVNAWNPYMRLHYGYYCNMMEPIFLSLYVFEAVIKIYAKRALYFSNAWDLFDFVIVGFAFFDLISGVVNENGFDQVMTIVTNSNAGDSASALFMGKVFKVLKITRVLKSLRSFKLLRLIKVFDKLMTILNTIIKSLVLVGAILLMLIIFHIFFSVLIFLNYCEVENQDFFSTFQGTVVTLLQVLSLDKWFGIYTHVTFSQNLETDYLLFIYLMSYIIVGYFLVLNLFVAVLVDNFQQTNIANETKEIIHQQVELEEKKLMHKIECGMNDLSDTNLLHRLELLHDIIEHDSKATLEEDDEDAYQGSDNEEYSRNEIKKEVMDNLRDTTKRSLGENFKEKDMREAFTLNAWYFRLLASIEKHAQMQSDKTVAHDRIIKIVCDDPEELTLM